MFNCMILEFQKNNYVSTKTGKDINGYKMSVLEYDKQSNLPTANKKDFWLNESFYKENEILLNSVKRGNFILIDINLEGRLIGVKKC